MDRPDDIQKMIDLRESFRRTFKTDDGERVLRAIMQTAGLAAVSHRPGDPCETAFHEGRRSLALEIMAYVRPIEESLMELTDGTDELL